MLIHSNNMETTVFIHECQNLTKTSKGMQESRHFQYNSRYLLLTLVTLLGLMFGGMVGLFTVWMSQNVVKSSFTCPQVTHQVNVSHRLIISGEESSYPIFTVQQNGTYFFYGKMQKNETSTKNCIDEIRLALRRPTVSEDVTKEEIKEARFCKNSGNYVAEIVAEVQLEENSVVYLEINCPINNDKTSFFYRVLYISQ
ncbi:hypothetical protein PHYPO_G00092590 [Pangasianodon hypophthalmus]|uniref:Uncharacterized protein n=1 Tax=Pangasianodon hypophthalmus TaxID=310915 RepID=A0A5N5LAH7_PANHP|nr:hypothetical protein PHYPO_G00092590 [Pangasianodon hypophthalmus]